MAQLTTQQIQVTGAAVTLVAAAAGGDTVTPGPRDVTYSTEVDLTVAAVRI